MTLPSIEEYLRAPCAALSIPYWKAARLTTPAHVTVLHRRELPHPETRGEAYFRLFHDLRAIGSTQAEGIDLVTAAPTDLEVMADVICRSYSDLSTTPDRLLASVPPAFRDPALWILARDRRSGACAGCAIAALDSTLGELSLEWVQVLPRYRRRYIASALVNELLLRGLRSARFATVSGKAASGAPEALYRACGFTGEDVWYVSTE